MHVASLFLAAATAFTFTQVTALEVKPITINVTRKFELLSKSDLLLQQPRSFFGNEHPEDVALNFVHTQLGIAKDTYTIKKSFRSKNTGVTHVHLKQVIDGIEISNADIAVHVNRRGRIIAYTDSFYRPSAKTRRAPAPRWPIGPFVKPLDAFTTLAQYIELPFSADNVVVVSNNSTQLNELKFTLEGVPGAFTPVQAQPSYLQTSTGVVEPTWEFYVDLYTDYLNAHVSADGKKILLLHNWASKAAYRVFDIGDSHPEQGNRTLITNVADKLASPLGWHDRGDGEGPTFELAGNNVQVAVPDASAPRGIRVPKYDNDTFDFPVDLTKEPDTYTDASAVNLFYTLNVLHDLFYQYGFDEKAGNFQRHNFGRGGDENDEVYAITQTPQLTNNALFIPTPDGLPPRMFVLLWTMTTPKRDGAFDSAVLAHEYGHGVTSRLTGTGTPACLRNPEADGLSEGWSDFFGYWIQMKPEHTRDSTKEMGVYVAGKSLRKYPYSTNLNVNPLTYGHLNDEFWAGSNHNMGTIWATMLYELYWNLVDELGFTSNLYSADPNKGNTLAMRLIIEALSTQPCNPTFIEARDTILEVDSDNYQGRHLCLIWRAFAKRGLGYLAKHDGTMFHQDFSLPPDCTK
jgi:extracellular elastinolytic metalloproteinase